MTIVQNKPAVPPLKIVAILFAPWAMQALKTSLELDVYSAIARGKTTAPEIARELKTDKRGTAMLLDALVGLEVLEKDGDKYALTEHASLYLLPSSPLFFGDFVCGREEMHKAWQQLTEAIKSGKPVNQVNQDAQAEDFFPKLAASIFPMNYTTAEMVARELQVEKLPAGSRVLDVAAGSAVWSIPIARLNKGLKVDVLDFPAVLEMTKTFTAKYEVADQYKELSGNWRDVKIERAAYDIVILGHILHSEGRDMSLKLIAECYEALKPGGKLVVAEFMSNDERTAPPQPLLFAINMFLATDDGCVFSDAELKKALLAQGFRSAERLDLPGWEKQSPIMLATK